VKSGFHLTYCIGIRPKVNQEVEGVTKGERQNDNGGQSPFKKDGCEGRAEGPGGDPNVREWNDSLSCALADGSGTADDDGHDVSSGTDSDKRRKGTSGLTKHGLEKERCGQLTRFCYEFLWNCCEVGYICQNVEDSNNEQSEGCSGFKGLDWFLNNLVSAVHLFRFPLACDSLP
jgi:hypothetical protein